jgi:hypothetical protein
MASSGVQPHEFEEKRMTARLAVTFVLLAVPAFGQSRVYTNADLGKITRTHNATEEELAGLRAHQFVLVREYAGPEVIVAGGSPSEGPFGPFYMPPRQPLGDQLFFGGFGGWGHRIRGPVTVSVPNLSYPPSVTVPSFARGPVPIAPPAPSAGRRPHETRR